MKKLFLIPLFCFFLGAQGDLSFQIYNLTTSEVVKEENANLQLTPASTSKLWTCIAALDQKGKTSDWKTTLTFYGQLKAGVLEGQMKIHFNGDPSWGADDFGGKEAFWEAFRQHLKSLGILKIKGNVVLSDSTIKPPPFSWTYSDLANYYAAYPSPFVYAENKSVLNWTITPKEVHLASVVPAYEMPFYSSQVSSSDQRGDQTYIIGTPFTPYKTVVGTLPNSRTQYSTKGVVNDPLKYFKTDMEAQGLFTPAPIPAGNLFQESSFTFVKYDELIRIALQNSHNLFTEALHLHFKTQKQLDLPTFILQVNNESKAYMYDACGLSPQNHFSASDHIALLKYAYNKYPNQIWNLLPIAGQSGTLKYFGRNNLLNGKVWAKSGSMSGVRSYVGYFKKNQQTYAFAITLNHYENASSSFSSKKHLENLLLKAYNEL